MPSMDMRLTWVIRLDPTFLGAHLQAYIKLLPTTQALRICNRFGKGKDVHVNRLPAEIVTQIESYLTKEEHSNAEAEWIMPHFCFAALCDPIDHYSNEELVRLRSHYSVVDGDNAEGQARAARLDEGEREALNECMKEGFERWEEILPGVECWRDRHDAARNVWADHVGDVGERDRGFFTEHKTLLRQHFGLDAWVSHAVQQRAWHDEDSTQSTLAYLTLPTSSATTKEWAQRLVGMECTVRLPTETTHEFCITPPAQPTDKSLARFARALKILDLESLPLNWRQDLVAGGEQKDESASEDIDGSSDESDVEANPENEQDQYGPALRLLVANKDDSAPEEI